MRDATLLIVGLLGVAAFLGLAFVVVGQGSVALDAVALRWTVDAVGPALRWILRAVTMLGSVPLLLAAIVGVAAWCLERGAPREAAIFIALCTVAEGANVLLKAWIARPRPLEFAQVLPPESHSFPSGHALMGTVVYGLAAILLARLAPAPRARWTYAIIALVLLIGLSRIGLGVHWPSDVIAGFALGVAFVAAGTLLLRRHGSARPRGKGRS